MDEKSSKFACELQPNEPMTFGLNCGPCKQKPFKWDATHKIMSSSVNINPNLFKHMCCTEATMVLWVKLSTGGYVV